MRPTIGRVSISADATTPATAPLGSADFANAVAGNGRFEIESAALARDESQTPPT